MLPQHSETDKPAAETRLLADAMLGKLAKWLRLLGYDTTYDPQWDDATILRLARAEDRVVLTRDRDLAARRGQQSLLLASDHWQEQLRQVINMLSLHEAQAGTRCSICNTALEAIEREDAVQHVPPYVRQTQGVFRRCPNCDRIYWPGGHWERMLSVMRTLWSTVDAEGGGETDHRMEHHEQG